MVVNSGARDRLLLPLQVMIAYVDATGRYHGIESLSGLLGCGHVRIVASVPWDPWAMLLVIPC